MFKSFLTKQYLSIRSQVLSSRRSFFGSLNVKRYDYSKLTEEDKTFFLNSLGREGVQTEDLEMYNTDWTHKYKGNSQIVLKPKTTEDVSKILKYCNDRRLAVVPQGGNTGLVGGSVPVFDEIIINMYRMNRIIGFDNISSTLHVEAGCILENLSNFLAERNYVMPLDLGAKGSCHIGGNLSTNAGGIHFVKYGSIRNNCKGIKAVLADGTIVDCMNPLPKNNTGYDLKHLFISSEGTLGIITEALINCHEKLNYTNLAFLGVERFEDIIQIYSKAKSSLRDYLNAIEFFDLASLELSEKHGNLSSPLGQKYPFYLLIEAASDNEKNSEVLENFVADLDIPDGVIAQDETQSKKIWEIRERLAEMAIKEGLCLKYDVSLKLEHFYKIVEDTRNRVGNLATTVGYGHIGDYNLHLNVCLPSYERNAQYEKVVELCEPWVFDYLKNIGGSVSAEHGIGILKTKYLDRTQSLENIHQMKLIKKALDRNWILNPYKVIDLA